MDGRAIDLHAAAGPDLAKLPYVLRIMLENVLRNAGDTSQDSAAAILGWLKSGHSAATIQFHPGRIMMHDTTCGPALVDIAAMRNALAEAGHDPATLSPVLPVDVSTDHSLAVDSFGHAGAMQQNLAAEYRRNAERYRFMKWAASTLDGFRVHPPGTGIMHTLNLERLASVVTRRDGWVMPDTMIGTDSHSPMVNGIGVLAWGVGGIEAESVMFGMPVALRIPDVVGVRMTGGLPAGTFSTDLALAVTERLRKRDLKGAFVEFFGPGVTTLSAGDRAVIANMTPEFGGATGFFPVDRAVLDYLRQTGRSADHIALVQDYCRRNGLWFDAGASPRFTEIVEIDLSRVTASLAGPRRPQDRIPASDIRAALGLDAMPGPGLGRGPVPQAAVAIAAITSCTNTTDPRLLIAAGLVARNARRRGLAPPAWVKTSLAPGSPTAGTMLRRAGLLDDLEAIGFGIVGYGCTTCIGNSGELLPGMRRAMDEGTIPVAVISGNRNFPRRIHGRIRDAFLASPPLVIAFALAGDANRDILRDPISGDVRLADLWPSAAEIDEALARAIDPADYPRDYDLAEASGDWARLDAPSGVLYPWDEGSTYLRRPPFANTGGTTHLGRYLAAPLAVFGDDITTDHISPAGAIPVDGEAGRYLSARGVPMPEMNVFASRRGNWEVMLRGLFTNPDARNLLADMPPGWTMGPDGKAQPLWQAAIAFARSRTDLVLVAGQRYGMGSSRDWAAKGVALLGVRAILASSFERIHRANLIGMGILPLRLPEGVHPEILSLRPQDRLAIAAEAQRIGTRQEVDVEIIRADGSVQKLIARADIETEREAALLRSGGIFREMLQQHMELASAHVV